MAIGTLVLANGNPVGKTATVDAEKSTINWTGKKVTGSHEGTINVERGTLAFDDSGMLVGGNLSIDMTSITCTDLKGGGAQKLVGHLNSDDFFGVEEFPTASIVFTEILKGRDGSLIVSGDLTIKGITKPITFDAKVSETSATATIVIERTQFGIKYGSGSFFDNLGDKTIDNDFTLEVSLSYE